MVEVIIPYKPRPLQLVEEQNQRRFNVMVCHRRWGKTVFAIAKTVREALSCPLRNPQYAYVAPTYGQAKRIAWEYIKEYVRPLVPYGAKIREAELSVDIPSINGYAKIMLLSAEKPDRLRGLYLDGVVLDEPAQQPAHLWTTIVRPTLADRKGWATFIGTPCGEDDFYDRFCYASDPGNEDWHACLYKASETGIIDPSELAAAKAEMDPDEFEQEFECSFQAAIKGAYYTHLINDAQNEDRICRKLWDKKLQVYTAWDLGMKDHTAIWFYQVLGTEYRIIDYYDNNGEGIEHYIDFMRSKPYNYADYHWLPHDAEVRELGTGKSRREVMQSLGLKTRIVPQLNVADGIQAVRNVLPRCWFDRENCADGLRALRHYRKDYNEKRQTFADRPLHDWSSHGADAFRYFAVAVRDKRGSPMRDKYSRYEPGGWLSS